MANYRSDVEQLLDQWVDEPGQGKNIVKATRDAQIRSDKKYEKEMATWPE